MPLEPLLDLLSSANFSSALYERMNDSRGFVTSSFHCALLFIIDNILTERRKNGKTEKRKEGKSENHPSSYRKYFSMCRTAFFVSKIPFRNYLNDEANVL